MKISILHTGEFNQEEPLPDLYTNSFPRHIAANRDIFELPHRHDICLCVFFPEGSGIHKIDFNSYSINRGNVFFLKPGQSHFWQFQQAPEGISSSIRRGSMTCIS